MSINLHLTDGSSYIVSKDFDSSDLNIELEDIMHKFSSRMNGKKEMSIAD